MGIPNHGKRMTRAENTRGMSMSTLTKMSNAIARKYYLHDCDTNHDTGLQCCYFAERDGDESGWGFWVQADGSVDTDTASANGEMPSARSSAIVASRSAIT